MLHFTCIIFPSYYHFSYAMTYNLETVITKTKLRIKEPKIFIVRYYRLLQNNQITLLLLIGTAMIIICCYKICFLF